MEGPSHDPGRPRRISVPAASALAYDVAKSPLLAATVLIAPAEHLAGLQEQRGLKGAHTFADTEAHIALEVITRERPTIVALERDFASSRRGVALMNRIKADPSLATTEVRIVYSRRAPRYRVSSMHAVIDGNPALVVDLSMIGAQVVSSTALRPNQRIRMTLEGDQGPRFNAAVAWATFELPAEGPRYRAGIHFQDANAAVITRLLETVSETSRQ